MYERHTLPPPGASRASGANAPEEVRGRGEDHKELASAFRSERLIGADALRSAHSAGSPLLRCWLLQCSPLLLLLTPFDSPAAAEVVALRSL